MLDARHHRKVLWEVSGDDSTNALPLQLLRRVQFWRRGEAENGYEGHQSSLCCSPLVDQRLTLIHAVEDLVELLLGVLTVVLLPALSSLTPEDHQLPLLPPEGSEVGDLHDHRTGGVEGRWCQSLRSTCSRI